MSTVSLTKPEKSGPAPVRTWFWSTVLAAPFVVALEFYLLSPSLLFFAAQNPGAAAFGVALLVAGGLAIGVFLGGVQALALRRTELAPLRWVGFTALAFAAQGPIFGVVLSGLYALGAGPALSGAAPNTQTTAALLAFALGGALLGLTLGVAQWRCLAGHPSRGRGAWLGANVLGWLVAIPLPFALLVAVVVQESLLWQAVVFVLAALPYAFATTWALRQVRT